MGAKRTFVSSSRNVRFWPFCALRYSAAMSGQADIRRARPKHLVGLKSERRDVR